MPKLLLDFKSGHPDCKSFPSLWCSGLNGNPTIKDRFDTFNFYKFLVLFSFCLIFIFLVRWKWSILFRKSIHREGLRIHFGRWSQKQGNQTKIYSWSKLFHYYQTARIEKIHHSISLRNVRRSRRFSNGNDRSDSPVKRNESIVATTTTTTTSEDDEIDSLNSELFNDFIWKPVHVNN